MMFVGWSNSLALQILLSLLFLQQINWTSSSKASALRNREIRSPGISFRQTVSLEKRKVNHTLLRDYLINKGLSGSAQSQARFQTGKKSLILIQRKGHKEKGNEIDIDDENLGVTTTSYDKNSISHFVAEVLPGKIPGRQQENETFPTNKQTSSADIPVSPLSELARIKPENPNLFNLAQEKVEKRKGDMDLLGNAPIKDSLGPYLRNTPTTLNSISSVYGSSTFSLLSLTTRKYKSTQHETSSSSSLNDARQQGDNWDMQARNFDVSLMKAETKSKNSSRKVNKRLEMGAAPFSSDLFLAAKSKQHLYNVILHFKRSNSSPKSTGSKIMKADVQSGETTDTSAEQRNAKEYSYLSKEKSDRKEEENGKNGETGVSRSSISSSASLVAAFSPDVNQITDLAVVNAASAVIKGETSESFTRNGSCNNSNGTTQQMVQITKPAEWEVGKKGNRNFARIVKVPIGRQKRNLDRYPRFATSAYLSGDQQTLSYAKDQAGLRTTRNRSNGNNDESSGSSGKIQKVATFLRGSVYNLTQRKITQGLSFPIPPSTATAAVKALTGVALQRPKVGKIAARVLETGSGEQTNNIHLQTGTTAKTSSSSASKVWTRNCSTLPSAGSQAYSSDVKMTENEMPLSQMEDLFERNKSRVGNVNDSLTSSSLGCKCQIKQGLHFKFPENSSVKLVLNSANISSGKSIETSTISSSSSSSTATEKNQLAKLYTLITTTSFELEKVVGTKAKSISVFDNSFDKTTQTVTTASKEKTGGNEQTKRRFYYRHHPEHTNKRSIFTRRNGVWKEVKRSSAFLEIEDYRRLRRDAIKENKLARNFDHLHQTELSHGKKIMFKPYPSHNNSTQKFTQTLTKQKSTFETAPGTPKKHTISILSPFDGVLLQTDIKAKNDVDLTKMSTEQQIRQDLTYSSTAKTIGDPFANNQLKFEKFNQRHHYHQNNDDVYHLQNETLSTGINQNSVADTQYHQQESTNFVLQKSNMRESRKPNSSSAMSRIFFPKTLSSENRLSASSHSSPCTTVSRSICDIKKSNVTAARSFNRKRNFPDDMKMKTAQGNELLALNLAFSSRPSSVNGRQQNDYSITRDGVQADVLIIQPTNTTTPINWRNASSRYHDSDNSTDSDDGGGATIGSDLGKNEKDTSLRFRQTTTGISKLVQLLRRKKKKKPMSVFSSAEERIRQRLFNENEKRNVLKRTRRDTGCAITTRSGYATDSSVRDGDECGTVELTDTVVEKERKNLTRKLIPLKENPFFSYLPLTGNERVASPIMNTNNNNRYNNDIASKDALSYQIDRKVGALLVPSSLPTNTESPFTSYEKPRPQHGKTTRKTADETEKVLANEYNFLGKQWMNDKVNGWSNDNPFNDRKDSSTRTKLFHNSLENELPTSVIMPSSETGLSDVHNSLGYKTTFQVDNSEERRLLRNKLSENMAKDSILKISMLTATQDVFSYTPVPSSSALLRSLSTLKPEKNNDERRKLDTVVGRMPHDSLSLHVNPSLNLMGGESSTTMKVFGKSIKNDASELNGEVDAASVLRGTESLKNYVFDSSSPTSLTPTNINVLTTPSSPYLSVASTTTETQGKIKSGKNINAFTTDVSAPSNVVGVKATNGSTPERTLSSTRFIHENTYSTHSIDKSKTDVGNGEPVTASVISASLSRLVFTVNDIDTVESGLSELSADDGSSATSKVTKQENTTPVPDGTMPPVSVPSTTTLANPVTTLTLQSESNFPPTTSPSEIISTSASVSHENLSPKGTLSTETQSVGHTDLPHGMTLMSTPAANLEDAIMLPTTTSTAISVQSDLENKNEKMSPGDAPIATSTDSSAPLPPNPVNQGEDSGNKETADVQPLECDSQMGMQYSEETKNCVCRAGLQYNEHEKKCINLMGNECIDGGETSSSDCPLNSFCKPLEMSGETKSVCTCVSGYIPTTDKSRCMAGWKTECTATSMSDINMQNLCHPDFDCVFSDGEMGGGKCDCKDNRTIGLSNSLEQRNSNATGSLKWKEEEPISCFLDYGSDCDPANDKCNDFRFLKCSQQSAKCECADSSNQLYDERNRECVARAGTFCTLAASEDEGEKTGNAQDEQMRYYLSCIGNSSCVRIGNETNSQFLGTCKCLEGHDQHWQGYCTMKGNSSSFNNQCNTILGLMCLSLILLRKFLGLNTTL